MGSMAQNAWDQQMIQEGEAYVLTYWIEEGYLNDSTINNHLPHVQQWYWKLKDEKENCNIPQPCS